MSSRIGQDPAWHGAVAWGVLSIVGLAACGPRVAPVGPGEEPTPTGPDLGPAPGEGLRPPAAVAREVAVGEMCPGSAEGRPGVTMVAARQSVSWTASPETLGSALARGTIGPFAVLGWGGRRVGNFTPAGPASDGTTTIAIGGYAGSLPCADEATAAECGRVRRGCGVAIASLGRPGNEEPLSPLAGGACVDGGSLIVDVDGDGRTERYRIEDFTDELRAPADAVAGGPAAAGRCAPRFALPDLIPAGKDPKGWQGLDVVGVVDVDGDRRLELVLEYEYGDRRTWAIYTPAGEPGTPPRLTLAAESQVQ